MSLINLSSFFLKKININGLDFIRLSSSWCFYPKWLTVSYQRHNGVSWWMIEFTIFLLMKVMIKWTAGLPQPVTGCTELHCSTNCPHRLTKLVFHWFRRSASKSPRMITKVHRHCKGCRSCFIVWSCWSSR